MSHTVRIYNTPIRKAHRIDLSSPRFELENILKSIEEGDLLRNAIHDYGFVFHPFRQLHMGCRCVMCKVNRRKERRMREREFLRMKELELTPMPPLPEVDSD